MAKNICIGWSRCCRADSASNGVRAILDPPVPSQNSIRSRNLGRYRPQRGPKTRSKFEFLFGRENSLFFAENSLLGLQKFPVRLRREFILQAIESAR